VKIVQISGGDAIYSSNAYLVLGDWKAIDDVNALVDAGADPAMVHALNDIPTGVGKKKIDKVILTHTHSDHTANLTLLKHTYRPKVCAFSPYYEGVDRVLKNGESLRLGDRRFEVIHIPGHSDDSIALFNREEGVLFAGDSPLGINSPGGSYGSGFVSALRALCRMNIRSIYFGHGDPLHKGARESLRNTLENVLKSGSACAGEPKRA
jgi:glyoxylase-like metal-dependent hydrolase (beta-lactamase superfamily II)